jgi:hypothetical protein
MQHLQGQRRIVLHMPATSVGRLRQSVLGVNHARSAGLKIRSAFMGMAKETGNESETSKFWGFVYGLRKCFFQGDGEASVPESKD